jgi:hypothetical protein
MLCPPTAGGGCTFCSSGCKIHGDEVGSSEDGDAHTYGH